MSVSVSVCVNIYLSLMASPPETSEPSHEPRTEQKDKNIKKEFAETDVDRRDPSVSDGCRSAFMPQTQNVLRLFVPLVLQLLLQLPVSLCWWLSLPLQVQEL